MVREREICTAPILFIYAIAFQTMSISLDQQRRLLVVVIALPLPVQIDGEWSGQTVRFDDTVLLFLVRIDLLFGALLEIVDVVRDDQSVALEAQIVINVLGERLLLVLRRVPFVHIAVDQVKVWFER